MSDRKTSILPPVLLGVSVAALVMLLPGMILNGMTITLLSAAASAAAAVAGALYAQKKYRAGCFALLRRLEGKSAVPMRFFRFLLEAVLLGYSVPFFQLVGEKNVALFSLAGLLHADFSQLLRFTPLLLALLALPGAAAVLLLFQFGWSALAGRAAAKPAARLALRVAVVFVVAALQYWSLEISSLKLLIKLFHGGLDVFFGNFCFVLLAEAVLALLLGNSKRSLTVLSVLITLWSIANYYTIQFHGSPLIFSEFKNAGTAMAVIGAYRFSISLQVVAALLLGLLELFLVFVSAPVLVRTGSRVRHLALQAVAVAVTGLAAGLLFPLVLSLNYKQWWAWSKSVSSCGFLVYSVQDLVLRANLVIEPDGYDESLLPQAGSEPLQLSGEAEYPDIILILNETFCDLDVYAGLETDVPALEAFYSLPCVARGYATVHGVGSGTNDSEFELLMSKSKYLLTQNSPFTCLNDEQLSRSVVPYLQALGYETTAMHQFDRNYNRNNAYPAIGFDHIYLGREQPNSDVSLYGFRDFTDAAFYEDLKLHYAQVDLSRPQLFYLMTYQNHGGFGQNGPEWDTVHVLTDMAEGLRDSANEYLTSTRMSAEAFRDLTEYYSRSDRKTIICMVGDHGPSFLPELPERNPDLTDEQHYIAEREVPFIIWANYETPVAGSDTALVSMADLVPMVLRAAGFPLSTFYSEILDLTEVLPVRMSNGIVMDRDGNTFVYPEDTFDALEQLKQYYYMEYNSLLPDEEYREELFMPPVSTGGGTDGAQ